MRLFTRRQYFACLAVGAAGAAGIGCAAWLDGLIEPSPGAGEPPSASPNDDLPVETQESRAFGTTVSVTVLHADRRTAREAAAAALAEIESVDRLMSFYQPESQLSRLNRQRVLEGPHPYLVAVLRHARAVSIQSAGAFDVTVQPLWTLYSEAKQAGRRPDVSAVRNAIANVDWRRVEVAPERIRIHGEGTAVTLNGIAQGFAADRAVDALRRRGIRHALVNSGEIGSLGDKGAGEPWTVGIRHPRRERAFVELAKLQGRSLATSGDYATAFDEEYRDHHIFDPRTGRSPQVFSSVSVAARTALEADALATAVFVLGPEDGLRLVRSTPGADALFVLKDRRTLATAGFPTAA